MKNISKPLSLVILAVSSVNVYALTDKIEFNIVGKTPNQNQKCKLTFKHTAERFAQCVAQDLKQLVKEGYCPSDDKMIYVADNCLLKSRIFPDDVGEMQYYIYDSKGKITNNLNSGK